MRKFYFLSLLVVMFFGACADEGETTEIVQTTPVSENPHRVSQMQALQNLANVLGVIRIVTAIL